MARSSPFRIARPVGAAVLTAVGAAAASPAPAPNPWTSGPARHQVPPAAPAPTSTANSPDAPDPNPPVGGTGPNGQDVGGAGLRSRGRVVPAGVPALPSDVDARAWMLVDLDSGDVLAGQDVHGRYQPASILKLLTAVTLLPDLPGNRVVTVGAAAANAEGSRAGLLAGGTYTVDNLFSGLLLVSGNDTAAAIAQTYGGVAKTVQAMNEEASKLGAYDTYVQTPSGLDGWQQLTSAYDMSLFVRAALDQPRFVAYDRQAAATLPAQHVGNVRIDPITLTNQTNNFLIQVPGALVAKIGFTDAAQHTYVCAAQRNGRRLGVALLRAQRYPVDQWQQAASLLDWGYALPASTPAVGHLDAPPADAMARPAAWSSANGSSRVGAARDGDHHATRFTAGIAIGAFALVVPGFAAAELSHRRRRRHSTV